MKSNSTQALLVALGAAVITSLLYYLTAQLQQSSGPSFVLFRLMELAPVAVLVLALLKFFVHEKLSFLTLTPIRVSRYPKRKDVKQF